MTALSDLYSRCPDCGFIAPPESMDYTLRPDDEIDWERPVHVTCLVCHARHDITSADVLQADAETACKRCAAAVTHPAGAARVRCTGCGLFLLGPDLDETQREELPHHRGPGRPRAPGDLPCGQAARRKAGRVVKIRLWGTADECRQMAQLLIDAWFPGGQRVGAVRRPGRVGAGTGLRRGTARRHAHGSARPGHGWGRTRRPPQGTPARR
jgi:hypothetical protein